MKNVQFITKHRSRSRGHSSYWFSSVSEGYIFLAKYGLEERIVEVYDTEGNSLLED